jgi:hypothetical protein
VTGGKKLSLGTKYSSSENGDLSREGEPSWLRRLGGHLALSGKIQTRFKAMLCRVKPRSLAGCLISKVLPNLEFLYLDFQIPVWTVSRVHQRIVTQSLATSR